MSVFAGFFVLPPYLDSLVRLPRNQPRTSKIEGGTIHPVLCLQASRLRRRLRLLIEIPRRVVPEGNDPVVPAAHGDAVVVDRQVVDHAVVPRHILQKRSIPAAPLSTGVGGSGHEGVLKGGSGERPHALLVVRQRGPAFSRRQVPHFDGAVVGSCDDHGIGRFGDQRADGVVVSREDVDLMFAPHVPDAGDGVASSGHEDVERRVHLEAEDAGEMAVVVADDLVGLEVPTLDHFVLSGGEKVGMARAEDEAAYGTHVAGEGQEEGVVGARGGAGKVKNFDGTVGGSGSEHGVGGIDGEGPDPAEVRRENRANFPGSVPRWNGKGRVGDIFRGSGRRCHENVIRG
mmetsp:Transcript_40194/g.94503  ORF Transcript_40194/g.94503 Transcript_40194/m.94503 type:complete len:344 (-) Transcript_40194:432-1463(-)